MYSEFKTRALFFAFVFATILLAALFKLGIQQPLKSPIGTLCVLAAVVASLRLATDKTLYLPFLAPTFIPPSVLKQEQDPRGTGDSSTLSIPITGLPEDATILIYWASDPSDAVADHPKTAYGQYQNSGIVPIMNGSAILRLWCPGRYKVPRSFPGGGKEIPRHVHYRYGRPDGMFSAVQTRYLTCLA
jgi:hypothetical protein